MNTQGDPITILCYGDSNTYGQRSDDFTKGRWPRTVRWTGQLQKLLGDSYSVIEEGLSGRTTNVEYTAEDKPGRNGEPYLLPCILSHNPIDVVILMLGTNDLKGQFNRSPQEIAEAIGELIVEIKANAKAHKGESKIIVLSPMPIEEGATAFPESFSPRYYKDCIGKSQQLVKPINAVAKSKDCIFIDAGLLAKPGEDGIHFSKESHKVFARHLAGVIQEL